MKQLTKTLGAMLFVLIGFNLNAQNIVYTSPTSSPNACDGVAYLDSTLVFDSWTWLQNDSTTVIQNGGYEVANLCSGQYYLSYTDSSGTFFEGFWVDTTTVGPCTNFSVSIDSIMSVSANGVCDGSMTAYFSGGTGAYTYSWSNGQTTQTITGLCAGTYAVTVVDGNNCSTSSTATITQPADSSDCANFGIELLSVTQATGPNACDGGASVMAYGSDGSESYAWNNNQAGSTLTNACPGSYVVTVSDSSGCTATLTVLISVDSTNVTYPLNAYVVPTDVSADGVCDGSANVVASYGTAPYTYAHSSGSTAQNATGLCAGVQSVIVIDAMGDSLLVNYIIASPSNIVDNGNYSDTTYTDTLTTDVLENCLLNYQAIDSAYISNITFITNDSILVTWTVMDGNGTITVNSTYTLTGGFGIYELILQLFCPQRGGNDYLVAKDQVLLNGTSLGLEEKTVNTVQVYPNPFTSQLNLELDEATSSVVTITDLSGKVVYQETHSGKSIVLETTNLRHGSYFLHVLNETGSVVTKIVK